VSGVNSKEMSGFTPGDYSRAEPAVNIITATWRGFADKSRGYLNLAISK
jgi:hypothetical protein